MNLIRALFICLLIVPGGSFADFSGKSFGITIGHGLDMALMNDQPVFSYYGNDRSLYFAEVVNDNLVETEVDILVVNVIRGEEAETSILIDSQNLPHIFFFDEIESKLKHASFDGVSWSVEDVAADGGFPSAIMCGANFCVCYQDTATTSLKLARGSIAAWNIETVDNSGGNLGKYCDIASDGAKDHVAYFDDTNKALKHAAHQNGSWSAEVVYQDNPELGFWPAIKVAPDSSIEIMSSAVKNSDTGESDMGLWQSIKIGSNNWQTGYYDDSPVGGYPDFCITQMVIDLLAIVI